jgi:hypothetical protein
MGHVLYLAFSRCRWCWWIPAPTVLCGRAVTASSCSRVLTLRGVCWRTPATPCRPTLHAATTSRDGAMKTCGCPSWSTMQPARTQLPTSWEPSATRGSGSGTDASPATRASLDSRWVIGLAVARLETLWGVACTMCEQKPHLSNIYNLNSFLKEYSSSSRRWLTALQSRWEHNYHHTRSRYNLRSHKSSTLHMSSCYYVSKVFCQNADISVSLYLSSVSPDIVLPHCFEGTSVDSTARTLWFLSPDVRRFKSCNSDASCSISTSVRLFNCQTSPFKQKLNLEIEH